MNEKAPVRVLYSFPDRIGKPGIGSIAWHQVKGVAEAGCRVIAVGTSFDRQPPGGVDCRTTLTVGGHRIPHRLLGGGGRAFRYHDWRTSCILKQLRDEIDLVHCWPLGALRTLRAARELGIPTFLERPNTHTSYAFEAVDKEMRNLGIPSPEGHSHTYDEKKLAWEEEEYQTADYLLAPSEFVRKTFLERGFSPEKVQLHQYGCDLDRFAPPTGSRPDGKPLTVAFVGRCEPRKGLHYALQAWVESGAAENGRFVVCGSFTPGYREALAKWLEHPSVEVKGFVSDVASVMRESDLFILPSVEEGSALVTYEARASGCVLVVSDATGAVCEHLKNGLVHAAGDSGQLREHLRLLNEDRRLLFRLRSQSLEEIDQLGWSYAGSRLASLYRENVSEQGFTSSHETSP